MRLTSVISYSPRAEGLSSLGDLDDAGIVKIKARHRPVRLGSGGFLFDRKWRGRRNRIEPPRSAPDRARDRRTRSRPVRAVTPDEAARLKLRAVEMLSPRTSIAGSPPTNASADNKSLRQPVGLGLLGIFNPDAPFRAVAKEARWNIGRSCGVEMISVSRIPASMMNPHRIIDHRLVVDGDEPVSRLQA